MDNKSPIPKSAHEQSTKPTHSPYSRLDFGEKMEVSEFDEKKIAHSSTTALTIKHHEDGKKKIITIEGLSPDCLH